MGGGGKEGGGGHKLIPNIDLNAAQSLLKKRTKKGTRLSDK